MKLDLSKYVQEMEQVACNACGATNDAVFAERERFNLPIRSVQCQNCGLMYLNPRPTKEQYAEYNRADYRVASFGTDEGSDILFNRQRAYTRDVIVPFVNTFGGHQITRALDIGCANGGIAAGLVDSYPDLDMHGIEPVVKHVEYAQSHVDMTIEQGLFEDYVTDLKFDLVIFAQALNHTLDPKGNLEKIRSLLSETGVLFISLQDTVSALLNRKRERMPEINHPYMFGEESIKYMMAAAGFDVVGWRGDTHDARNMDTSDISGLTFRRMLVLARPKMITDKEVLQKPDATDIMERAEANINFYSTHKHEIDKWQQPNFWRKVIRRLRSL